MSHFVSVFQNVHSNYPKFRFISIRSVAAFACCDDYARKFLPSQKVRVPELSKSSKKFKFVAYEFFMVNLRATQV